MKSFGITLILLSTLIGACNTRQTVVYVTPQSSNRVPNAADHHFTTIQQAKNHIRRLIQNGLNEDITVILSGGTYYLAEPLVFTPQDSGNDVYKITYTAGQGQKVLLSAGRSITGWHKIDPHRNLWSVDLPDVKQGKWDFRQLFADDRRLTRARFPNTGRFLTIKKVDPSEKTFELDQPIPAIQSSDHAEAVFYRSWCTSRVRIESASGNKITTRNSPNDNHPNKAKRTRTLYLEHAREFLDQPGEWFLDKSKGILYYLAANGEQPDRMNFIAPVGEQLLRIEGTKDHPVKNLHFKNLLFAHTAWQLPQFGYRSVQAGQHTPDYKNQPSEALPLAVQLACAQKCSFTGSRFAHTGASGLGLARRCRNNTIRNCEFTDIGANAIMVGWHPKEDNVKGQWLKNLSPDWTDPLDAPSDNTISDNNIHHCAAVFPGGVGIWIAFSPRTRILHNNIADMPYTGISVGFIWNDSPTTQKENIIAWNHIHHIMTQMYDGGGIYLLGCQPGTRVHHNLIHDSVNGRGIYTDEGSSFITIENNILYNFGDYAYLHHYGHNNLITNNIIAAADKNLVYRFKDTPERSFTMTHNIFWTDRGQGPFKGPMPDDTVKLDNNLYWDTRSKPITFDGRSFRQWQALDRDTHSVIADPLFVDPQNSDFHLQPDSPARNVGFQPIDLTAAGPRKF